VVAIAMSGLARYIGTHPLLRAQVDKIGHWALPLLLIAIGLMILSNKPDDVFVAESDQPSVAVALVLSASGATYTLAKELDGC
jgi:hypothetical protein